MYEFLVIIQFINVILLLNKFEFILNLNFNTSLKLTNIYLSIEGL